MALGLFDEDDYIRHLGDRIVALAPRDASALLLYLNADVALTLCFGVQQQESRIGKWLSLDL